jgi:hypothetical protein
MAFSRAVHLGGAGAFQRFDGAKNRGPGIGPAVQADGAAHESRALSKSLIKAVVSFMNG